ncbi:FliA/WhiG family RNA polymerase sigma factor [Cereibacter sphaeroides]|uniref:sigma-70 family RNA polymerase sigma factor n=1 Tax=Rhodobacterales TaxID=204455 RepID=UPI000BBE34A4|nr:MULTISPECIES: FliA/WhiG family RNA polymerase sigma factor [Paracoccaceae]MCE6952956.1 FliA/WhiG family RNA polymerase sigma factor [Cereibacter sphaeroides]MCE6961946.1 FliA/WhiG family RNA polymerase sigma factor [Cereibacter sphaeroides]MCE6970721.1 FliA/WhiG family RNA polymerase sigma factor [Cereibacter sphaeroides]MCE6975683.1 FliA/WhiG family RNA polymerase sigma factor [Cereibacter sphaeroides]
MIHSRGYAEQAQTPERLVRGHMDLVRRIAWSLHARIGRKVEIDDMIQIGYMGLVDASHRYEPRDGVSFAAYAAIRIRGSIMDFLRSNSTLCRTTIVMQQKVKAAVQRLEGRLMRAPETPEIAEELGMPVSDYQDWLAEFASSHTASLDEVYDDQSTLFQGSDPSAEDQLQLTQMRGLLRRALGRMPEREALLLQLIFVEELNVYEVAEILGVTTGRVSQIKKAAIERLRGFIGEMQGED